MNNIRKPLLYSRCAWISFSILLQELRLVGPSVLLVQLCSLNPHMVPAQPHSLQLDPWRTVSNLTSLLLTWAWPQHTACLASFRLQFSRYR